MRIMALALEEECTDYYIVFHQTYVRYLNNVHDTTFQ